MFFLQLMRLIIRILFSKVAIILYLVVLLLGFIIMVEKVETHLQTPLNLPTEGIVLDVTPGMTIEGVIAQLTEKDLLQEGNYLKWYARLTGEASKLKVGEYALDPTLTPIELLSLLTSGRSIQYSFTLIEGWNFTQVRDALERSPYLKQTLKGLTHDEVMTTLGFDGAPYEGYFLPDTYFFPKNYSDADLLKRSYEAMDQVVTDAWEKRDKNLPIKNPHELLTLASIVEKESAIPEERSEIAGVFVRRLQKGMRLQTDPTVIYGLGDRYAGNGKIYRSDLKRDTPYNTYTRDGLPPTPIAMPSREAIWAASHPKAGKSLYFVAKGPVSEGHRFSDTLEEHNRAVRAYRQWESSQKNRSQSGD